VLAQALILGGQAVATAALMRRLLPGRRRQPPIAPQPARPGDAGTVDVLLVTLDEASRIGPCLAGLQRQSPSLAQAIVVDSRSLDGTAALIDAAAREGHYDVVSFAPRFDGQRTLERWLQPALLTTLIYRFGAPGTEARPTRVRANGQCFLARRERRARRRVGRRRYRSRSGSRVDPRPRCRGTPDDARSIDRDDRVPAFVDRVAVPLMRRVGDEWHAGRLDAAEEHLVSSVVEELIAESMRSLLPGNGAPAVVVATPAAERHAIGAVAVGLTAALERWRVVFLGSDLPAADIASAALASRARVVTVSITYVDDRSRVLTELETLRRLLPPSVRMIVGDAGAAALAGALGPLGVHVGTSLDMLRVELRR